MHIPYSNMEKNSWGWTWHTVVGVVEEGEVGQGEEAQVEVSWYHRHQFVYGNHQVYNNYIYT